MTPTLNLSGRGGGGAGEALATPFFAKKLNISVSPWKTS